MEQAPCWRKAYRSNGVKRVVRSRSAPQKEIILKNSLLLTEFSANSASESGPAFITLVFTVMWRSLAWYMVIVLVNP